MPVDMLFALFLSLLGFLVGILAGLIGVGGAILTIPALLYVYPLLFPKLPPMPMAFITGITAMQTLAAGASSVRVHWKKNNIDAPLVVAVGLWSMLGGYLGGLTTRWYSDFFLKALFAFLMASVAYLLIRKQMSLTQEREAEAAIEAMVPPGPDTAKPPVSVLKGKQLKVAAISLLVGYSAGILGVGGAVFILPIFSQWLRLPVRMAIGSTTGVIAMTCLASLVGKVQMGDFPWIESLLVATGALFGANLGAKLSFRVSESRLLLVFISIVAITLLRVLFELFLGY